MLAAVIAEAVALSLLGLLVAGLLRSHAEIMRALHELGASLDPDAGSPGPVPVALGAGLHGGRVVAPGRDPTQDAAHDVVGVRLDGSAVALAVAGARHDTLLAFLSTGCSTCAPFWSALRGPADVPGGARLVVVVQDEESESRLRRLAGTEIDVVASSAAWEAYGVPGSPHFVYVDGPAGRVVGEGTAPTWEQVRDLLGQAGADRRLSAARNGQHPGDPRDDDPRDDDPRDSDPRDSDPRDSAQRVDAELLAAGIGPGHPSLYGPPETGLAGRADAGRWRRS
ncbi:MAG: TlpA family protein disulfide reductase [Frankiaceae bacterium]